ncbi:Uncharacterized protein APZ42_011532 [Daphnia magna]|uniref:Uncharacterized protein n=1 Tax=Daphnia magna TaxID=35525 RepID=A0A162SRJ8_9CRUS|nr:Uncharacterized protein APZ42_011532 [Daphnia magna]
MDPLPNWKCYFIFLSCYSIISVGHVMKFFIGFKTNLVTKNNFKKKQKWMSIWKCGEILLLRHNAPLRTNLRRNISHKS